MNRFCVRNDTYCNQREERYQKARRASTLVAYSNTFEEIEIKQTRPRIYSNLPLTLTSHSSLTLSDFPELHKI